MLRIAQNLCKWSSEVLQKKENEEIYAGIDLRKMSIQAYLL